MSDWLNMEFISKYAPLYVEAAGLTVKIAFFGILFSLIVGVICSAVQYYKLPVLGWIVAVYIELSRNTPLGVWRGISAVLFCLLAHFPAGKEIGTALEVIVRG